MARMETTDLGLTVLLTPKAAEPGDRPEWPVAEVFGMAGSLPATWSSLPFGTTPSRESRCEFSFVQSIADIYVGRAHAICDDVLGVRGSCTRNRRLVHVSIHTRPRTFCRLSLWDSHSYDPLGD